MPAVPCAKNGVLAVVRLTEPGTTTPGVQNWSRIHSTAVSVPGLSKSAV